MDVKQHNYRFCYDSPTKRTSVFFVFRCIINSESSLLFELCKLSFTLLEFMYLVFTRMPGESCRRRLGSLLLYLCEVLRAVITPLCVDFVLL